MGCISWAFSGAQKLRPQGLGTGLGFGGEPSQTDHCPTEPYGAGRGSENRAFGEDPEEKRGGLALERWEGASRWAPALDAESRAD